MNDTKSNSTHITPNNDLSQGFDWGKLRDYGALAAVFICFLIIFFYLYRYYSREAERLAQEQERREGGIRMNGIAVELQRIGLPAGPE